MNKFLCAVSLFAATALGQLSAADADFVPADGSYCCDQFDGLYFNADVLYGKLRQEGFDFGQATQVSVGAQTTIGINSTTTTVGRIKDHSLNFDWRWGVRLGVGYNFCLCDYNLATEIDWVYLRGHGHGNGSENGLHSHGKWDSHYNVVNGIVLSPRYCCGSCFNLQLFGGVRYADIDQKYFAHAESASVATVTGAGVNLGRNVFERDEKADFWGIGPQIGLKGSWDLGCGFSLFGKAAAAVLYGHFDTKHKFSTTFAQTSAFFNFNDSQLINQKTKINRCQTVADFALGLAWCHNICFCNREFDIIMKLSWEHFQWFNTNKLQNTGDLCYDGVTLSSTIGF